MTPQEKAVELVEMYYKILPFAESLAKDSALATVSEIMKLITGMPVSTVDRLDYWSDVKKEIEKL